MRSGTCSAYRSPADRCVLIPRSGDVYRAIDRETSAPVALKVMTSEGASRCAGRRRRNRCDAGRSVARGTVEETEEARAVIQAAAARLLERLPENARTLELARLWAKDAL